MAMHTSTQNADVILSQQFKNKLNNASHKYGILDYKNKKNSKKKKWTNRDYHVKKNEYVEHQDVKIYCTKNNFP